MSFLTLNERKKEGKFNPESDISQIFKPRPKVIPKGFFDTAKPNESYQADILYMPNDSGYKYALSVIDVASRYKDSRPLKTKSSKEVTQAITDIYTKSLLKWPKKITVDPGSEFKGEFMKEMKRHETQVIEAKSKKNVALVERMNRTVAERAFIAQYEKELENIDNGDFTRNKEWIYNLPKIIDYLNNSVTRSIGEEPVKAIKNESVKLSIPKYHRRVGEQEKLFELGTTVRYLLEPGKEENEKRRRATDPIWSLTKHTIVRIMVLKKQPVRFWINDIKRSFVREKLQVIKQD